MSNAHKFPRFVQDLRRGAAVGDFRLEELQRSRMIEPRIEGFVDLTERPFADLANEEQVAPPRGCCAPPSDDEGASRGVMLAVTVSAN